MKKLLKVLLIIIAIIVVLGIAMSACTAGAVKSVDNSIKEIQQDSDNETKRAQELAKDLKWEQKKDKVTGWTTFTTTFKNDSDKEFKYIEFRFTLTDKDGVVVDKSMTNLADVKAGESRKVEFTAMKEFKDYSVEVTTNALQ